MKLVCRKCEKFMKFTELESPGKESLGITFDCEQCGASISMVTNAGETQMVKALGVKLGGRSDVPAPMELTRANLADSHQAPSPAAPASAIEETTEKSMGKCPFANALPELMGEQKKAAEKPAPSREVEWTAEGWDRLQNVPTFVRGYAKTMIEEMAREAGSYRVDSALMDSAKEKFM